MCFQILSCSTLLQFVRVSLLLWVPVYKKVFTDQNHSCTCILTFRYIMRPPWPQRLQTVPFTTIFENRGKTVIKFPAVGNKANRYYKVRFYPLCTNRSYNHPWSSDWSRGLSPKEKIIWMYPGNISNLFLFNKHLVFCFESWEISIVLLDVT